MRSKRSKQPIKPRMSWTGGNKIKHLRALRSTRDTLVALCDFDHVLVIAHASDTLLYAACLSGACMYPNILHFRVYQTGTVVRLCQLPWNDVVLPLTRIGRRALTLAAALYSDLPEKMSAHALLIKRSCFAHAQEAYYARGYVQYSMSPIGSCASTHLLRLHLIYKGRQPRSVEVGNLVHRGQNIKSLTVQAETGDVLGVLYDFTNPAFGAFKVFVFKARTARYLRVCVVISHQY